MATPSDSVEVLTQAIGPVPGAVNVYARVLREAGFWPAAGKGGGQRSPHVQPHHLSNMLLSLAAHQPSEAVQGLEKLRVLTRRWGVPDDAWAPPGTPAAEAIARARIPPKADGTLHSRLIHLIEQGADDPSYLERELGGRWGLALCTVPAFATETWPEPPASGEVVDLRDRRSLMVYPYGAPEQPSLFPEDRRGITHRVFHLGHVALAAACGLWADSKARSCQPSSTSAASTATVKTKNASSPARDEAPTRDQDRTNGPATSKQVVA